MKKGKIPVYWSFQTKLRRNEERSGGSIQIKTPMRGDRVWGKFGARVEDNDYDTLSVSRLG